MALDKTKGINSLACPIWTSGVEQTLRCHVTDGPAMPLIGFPWACKGEVHDPQLCLVLNHDVPKLEVIMGQGQLDLGVQQEVHNLPHPLTDEEHLNGFAQDGTGCQVLSQRGSLHMGKVMGQSDRESHGTLYVGHGNGNLTRFREQGRTRILQRGNGGYGMRDLHVSEKPEASVLGLATGLGTLDGHDLARCHASRVHSSE